MKRREIICALCMSTALALGGVSAACAEEVTDEGSQSVEVGSIGEIAQDLEAAGNTSSGSGIVEGVLPASENEGFIIDESDPLPKGDAPAGEEAPSGGDAPSDGGLTIELIVEEQTVVDDPGMVDNRKIEEGVEALAKEQEKESLIPRLFRSNIVYSVPEVMNAVYSYLRNELGFNHAAACGILGNIQYESGSNPGAVGDGGSSYGLCQWHNGRCKDLIGYCLSRNVPFSSVDGQMSYLNYELSGAFQGVRNYLYSVPDTAQGAYDAASYWCRYFEMPLNTGVEAVKRGEFAANVLFWTDFSNLSTMTEEELAAQDILEAPSELLMPEGEVDELQVAYTAALSSAVEEGGEQLIQNVKDCYLFVDDVVQTGKEVCSYLGDKFYVPEETITAGIKSIVAEGYSRYEQMTR